MILGLIRRVRVQSNFKSSTLTLSDRKAIDIDTVLANMTCQDKYIRLTRVSFKRLELSSCFGKVVDIVFCVQAKSQEEHNFGSGCCQALSCCSGNMIVLIMINDCTNVIVALFATNATFQ